ncbi:glycosyl transferase family 2 [Verrucomicrobia bacterium LW23]|nr:glycosyl transferase family 2 [Verrucomicrobia bacterium LW23]
MEISVVIPTYRRPALLQRCLEALALQSMDVAEYEIVVVDDAACDQARCHIEAWAHRPGSPPIRYFATAGRRGPATARNIGWSAAQGKIIAFTDDDTVPDTEWLCEGIAAFDSAPEALAASGRVVVPLPPDPTDYERNESNLETAEFVTANCFVRRDVLKTLGGFDERFRAAWREDSDLHFRLLAYAAQHGGTVIAARRAVVLHPVRPASWGVSLWQQSKAQYNALLYKLHPVFYQQRIQKSPPLLYYLIVATASTAFLFFTLALYSLSITFILLSTALVFCFCANRLRNTSRNISHIAEMLVTSALIPFLSVFWRLYGAASHRVIFF